MADSKDPPKPENTPENPSTGAPLDVVLEVLANASGQLQGLHGADLLDHVTSMVDSIKTLATKVEQQVPKDELTQSATAEVQRIVDLFTRTGTATGAAVAQNREAIARSLRGVELNKVGAALRLLADWMQNPTPEREAQGKQLIEDLQKTVGPVVGYTPELERAARNEKIKADVKASLDQIFRGKKKT